MEVPATLSLNYFSVLHKLTAKIFLPVPVRFKKVLLI